MAEIWLRENVDRRWHCHVERVRSGWYRAACGWVTHLRSTGGIWSVKRGDPGPPLEERCAECLAAAVTRAS